MSGCLFAVTKKHSLFAATSPLPLFVFTLLFLHSLLLGHSLLLCLLRWAFLLGGSLHQHHRRRRKRGSSRCCTGRCRAHLPPWRTCPPQPRPCLNLQRENTPCASPKGQGHAQVVPPERRCSCAELRPVGPCQTQRIPHQIVCVALKVVLQSIERSAGDAALLRHSVRQQCACETVERHRLHGKRRLRGELRAFSCGDGPGG